jgi:4-hydroxyacetophenone monooxygenase
MTKVHIPTTDELRTASDEVIEDAVQYADPMVLRGLVYQLTGDPELKALPIERSFAAAALWETWAPVDQDGVAFLRRKAADFLKAYRDAGAGPMEIGPHERIAESLELITGDKIPEHKLGFYLEELALDPQVRSLKWREQPDAERLSDFTVTIVGAAMGGLHVAMQLKRAGISYTMIEKNDDVGGTWYENQYPGARVDTPSRGYTHLYGLDFGYPYSYCPQSENKKYFDWIADSFDLRKHIAFNTEARAMRWNEADAMWEIDIKGPDGERTIRSRAVITAVGFLCRPKVPDYPGAQDFQGGSWHSARWPKDVEWRGKRIAVVGTGASGYQMIPELALEAAHVTVFQRTAQWVFPNQRYRRPLPLQINWLDRNLPFHTNFMRFRALYREGLEQIAEIDPDFVDPWSRSAANKRAREAAMLFLESKIRDPELLAAMTPPHPVLSARPIMVDTEYSVIDAVQRDDVTLVSSGIESITGTGILAKDGTHHEVDYIVYATGFHATEYLFPMTITGRGGETIEQLWAKDGARAYRGCMMPGFPNLFSVYGPNTNGIMHVAAVQELTTHHILKCIERAIEQGKRTIEVKEEPYWEYSRLLDTHNRRRVWSDPRAHNYYWTKYDRSAVMNPLSPPEQWAIMRKTDFDDLIIA